MLVGNELDIRWSSFKLSDFSVFFCVEAQLVKSKAMTKTNFFVVFISKNIEHFFTIKGIFMIIKNIVMALGIIFFSNYVFAQESQFYSFTALDSKNKEVKMSDFKNKTVLVVNVASKCGYTKQYEGLQNLYKKHGSKNFVILGFPSNDFMGQEPGSNEEIQKFCQLTYGVKFPVFAKVKVNGDEAAPIYKWLTSQKKFDGRITWNFNKFLINKKGEVVKRFGSSDKPEDIEKDIVSIL